MRPAGLWTSADKDDSTEEQVSHEREEVVDEPTGHRGGLMHDREQ